MEKIKSQGEKQPNIFNNKERRLPQLSSYNQINSQRQHIKNKYQQYITNRRKSLEQNKDLILNQSQISFTEDIKMPRISYLTQDRKKIGQILRQTINKYNYSKTYNEKMSNQLNRKKKKYQQILKIRQQHHIQKMQRKKSRVEFQNVISEQKKQMRKTVIMEKSLGQSRNICFNEKKIKGDQLREQYSLNKSRIIIQQKKQLESKKRRHSKILIEERQFRKKKIYLEESRHRSITENYYSKIQEQINKNQKLDKINKKTQTKILRKMEQLAKERQEYETDITKYQILLKQKKKRKTIGGFSYRKPLFSTTSGMAFSQDM